MHLRPILKHIIFQFVDEVDSKGQFVQTTNWGFTIPGHFDSSAKSPRWATITHAGPDCKDVKVGQQVLIDALKWTPGFKFEGERFWRTDETQIVVARNTPKSKIHPLRDIVIFKRHDEKVNEGKHGLQIVGESVIETPKGTVTLVGPKCTEKLDGTVIYYHEENFFSKFEHQKENLWYIREQDILAYQSND
ncbi:MAG: hypothetical protein E4H14_02440 [Candidatus Thorarchaeota archaeon]|nr:MAG: hypothetical protein E4H14_02440 [Candidatus Thorarchaeota archaeon]